MSERGKQLKQREEQEGSGCEGEVSARRKDWWDCYSRSKASVRYSHGKDQVRHSHDEIDDS